MKLRLTAAITTAAVTLGVLSLAAPAEASTTYSAPLRTAAASMPVAAENVVRLSGPDRYSTAVAISQDTYPTGGAPVVFVASGENYPDGLSAGPAAGLAGGPVLLVPRDRIPDVTLTEIGRLRPGRIVIVGGAGVVSPAVEEHLKALAHQVERWSGADRYATAADVARRSHPGGSSVAYLASGGGFADALAAGPVAAQQDAPILLTPATMSADTQRVLADLHVNEVIVVGGTGAVSAAVESQLRGLGYTVRRISGSDRFATAAALSRSAFGAASETEVFMASGSNFPDALGAGAAAAHRGVPLLLTPTACLPQSTADEINRVGATRLRVAGGTGAISGTAASRSICQPTPPPPPPPPPCDANYAGGCVPVVSYDLDCADIRFQVRVVGTDRHRFDSDSDGWGCESYG